MPILFQSDDRARLWNEKGKPLPTLAIEGVIVGCYSAQAFPNGNIVTRDSDTIRIWEIREEEAPAVIAPAPAAPASEESNKGRQASSESA